MNFENLRMIDCDGVDGDGDDEEMMGEEENRRRIEDDVGWTESERAIEGEGSVRKAHKQVGQPTSNR